MRTGSILSGDTERVAAELGIPSTHEAWLAELAALDPEPAPLPDQGSLLEIFAHLNIPAQDHDELLALLPQAAQPEAQWLIERCRHLLVTGLGGTAPLSRWPELPGAFGRYAYVYVYLATLGDIRRYHAERGIPDEVSWETLADLGRHMTVYRKIRGVGGLHARPWLTRHFRGTIYSLGRLQFAMHQQTGEPTGGPVADGEWLLGVHIPEAGPMTPAASSARSAVTRSSGSHATCTGCSPCSASSRPHSRPRRPRWSTWRPGCWRRTPAGPSSTPAR